MKKLFGFLALVLFLLPACKKTEIIGPLNVTTVIYTVQANQWQQQTNGWYFNIPVPQITQSVLDGGAVIVYLVSENGGKEYEEPLPFTFPYPIADSEIDYVQLQSVQIAVDAIINPGAIKYRIVITAGP